MIRPPETFATARLFARPPRASDAPAVFSAYASDPAITRFLLWRTYETVEPLAAYLAQSAAAWDKHGPSFTWLLCLADTDTPIGSIGVELGGGKALFGYVLAQPHHGRGLMTEALAFLVGWALTQPEIFRAWAFCDVENPASARVMAKAGLTREGVLRRWQIAPNIGPEPRDCLAYAKVK